MRKMTKAIAENQKVFVGLEDSKRTWKLEVRAQDRRIHRLSIPADCSQLRAYLRGRYPGCRIKVIYEAGFSGFWLHDYLVSEGFECVVTPPHTVLEEKGKRVKTDKVDAARLAKLLEHNDYKHCHVPSKARREDRQISRTLIQIQKKIVSTRNQMRKFLDYHGLNEGFRPGRWGVSEYRRAMRMDLGGSLGIAWKSLVRILRFLQEEKKGLCRMLRELSKKEAYSRMVTLYSSVPGIGWFTAIRLALEWGDISRFSQGDKFSSFLGLVCSESSSGETRHQGRITGLGAGFVRRWLVECSWRAIEADPVLREKFNRVWTHSGSKKKAIVAVARKLAVRLRALFLTDTPYQLGVIR